MNDNTITPLQTLIDAVEAGGWEHGEVTLPRIGPNGNELFTEAYYGSLDAAKELHEALLPGYGWGAGPWGARVWLYSDNPKWDGSVRQEVDLVDAPARAWLLAILKAHQAQGGGK